MVHEDAFVTVEDMCAGGRVCIGPPFSWDNAFEFVPLVPVFERGGEDDLKPFFVGVLGGGRTVADLGVAGGIEVVVVELELEDQVPASVGEDVVLFVEEEEEEGEVHPVEEEASWKTRMQEPPLSQTGMASSWKRTQHSNASQILRMKHERLRRQASDKLTYLSLQLSILLSLHLPYRLLGSFRCFLGMRIKPEWLSVRTCFHGDV